MTGLPILSIVTFLPLVGALVIIGFRVLAGASFAAGASKSIALVITLATFVASLFALGQTVKAAADASDVVMVTTGVRHFRH